MGDRLSSSNEKVQDDYMHRLTSGPAQQAHDLSKTKDGAWVKGRRDEVGKRGGVGWGGQKGDEVKKKKKKRS